MRLEKFAAFLTPWLPAYEYVAPGNQLKIKHILIVLATAQLIMWLR